jgi:hypothetical protein
VAISYRELRTELVAPTVFKITPLHGPQGKRCLLLLRMHVYSFVAWQQTFYCFMRLLGANSTENTVSPILLSRSYGIFTSRCIETAVPLLLPVFVTVRTLTDIPLLLQKLPICHNMYVYILCIYSYVHCRHG